MEDEIRPLGRIRRVLGIVRRGCALGRSFIGGAGAGAGVGRRVKSVDRTRRVVGEAGGDEVRHLNEVFVVAHSANDRLKLEVSLRGDAVR